MKLLLVYVILILTNLKVFVDGHDDYCFGKDTDRSQTRHFTSKTAYQIIKGTNTENQYIVPECTPKKLWIFHRHGTRLPSVKTIQDAPRLDVLRDEIVKNYRIRRTKPASNALCQEDLVALQMWKWNASIIADQAYFLSAQGYEDLKGTAKTYQRYLGDVLTKNYNNTYYKFRHTGTQRTSESFKAFVAGLFGPNNHVQSEPIPEQDLLLRPYDYCESWKSNDYSGVDSESYKYKHSHIWNETLSDISTRLGFQYILESSDIELMWDICRYEQAWQVDRTSVWCAAFTPEQVAVLEYEDDVKYYYKLGYGYEKNIRLNCRAVQDMIAHLNSPTMPNVAVYFGHSNGIQTLLAALSIAKDDIALTANNYNEMKNRRWRTSNLDPFASNFAVVKYDCPVDPINQDKVIFFLNQNAVDFEWCTVGLCNWSEVLNRYNKLYMADCSTYYCMDAGVSSTVVSLSVLLFTAAIYLI